MTQIYQTEKMLEEFSFFFTLLNKYFTNGVNFDINYES